MRLLQQPSRQRLVVVHTVLPGEEGDLVAVHEKSPLRWAWRFITEHHVAFDGDVLTGNEAAAHEEEVGLRHSSVVATRRRGDGALDVHLRDLKAVGVDWAAGLLLSLLRVEGDLECLTHPQAAPSSAQVDQCMTIDLTTFMAAFGLQKQAVN